MNPNSPVYIISKGRYEVRLTADAFEEMGVPYYIIVEPQEYEKYKEVIKTGVVLTLPQEYKDKYETCDPKGDAEGKGKGPGAARNYAWDHAISLKADKHWVLDDNIDGFSRLNNNRKIRVADGTIFKCAEDFVDRYENVVISGFNYDFFAKARQKIPPYITNTRIYSCLLIRNDIKYRWRGRYNEDTDLSLMALKDGLCTVQFNAFLQNKVKTQTLAGGNTAEFYAKEGTLPKSQLLKEMHPDVTEVVWKFGRWHHHVDYRSFARNKLRKKPNIIIPEGINNYGMNLIELNGKN